MSELERLRWKKFPVLDDGFVCLVDCMGNDSSIVQAARVSYGRDKRDDEKDSEKSQRNLIRYLMRHRHTTPFEMAEIKLLVRVPMDCWRQWIRHRTANVNEYSTRYTEAIDSQQRTAPSEWRLQSKSNKQGSGGFVEDWPEDIATCDGGKSVCLHNAPYDRRYKPGDVLSEQEEILHSNAREVYENRLLCGVAKEQARKDLPLSTYTEAYWKIDLHNLFHFLSLRMHSHAQKEIRDYARTIGENVVAPLFPIAWEAFCDYRLEGMFLTALDQRVIKRIVEWGTDCSEKETVRIANEAVEEWAESPNRCRERAECIEKIRKLGFVNDE